MLRNTSNSNSIPSNFSIPKGTSLGKILAFLDTKLPSFPQQLPNGLKHEDEFSQDCCIYLNREARDTFFMFHFQYKYLGSQRTSDMSIISAQKYESKEPLLIVEAKRLPTPGSGRTREYVQGNLGGIERFKREVHGVGLKQSVILGYIQKESFDYWHKEVCTWIDDLIRSNNDTTISWDKGDLLTLNTTLNKVNKYKSVNSRVKSNPIELLHYWIYMS